MKMLLPLLAIAATLTGTVTGQAPLQQAEAAITAPNLLRHITELSSDAYTGRAPGTEGETKSVAYIIAQCRALGLEPGSPTGSFTQTVELWGMLSHGTLSLRANGKEMPLTAGQDYAAWSSLPVPKLHVSASALAFVGYGVVAPEYHWNDYAGLDVHGKTVIVLSGDPPVADPSDPPSSTRRPSSAKHSPYTAAPARRWRRPSSTAQPPSSWSPPPRRPARRCFRTTPAKP